MTFAQTENNEVAVLLARIMGRIRALRTLKMCSGDVRKGRDGESHSYSKNSMQITWKSLQNVLCCQPRTKIGSLFEFPLRVCILALRTVQQVIPNLYCASVNPLSPLWNVEQFPALGCHQHWIGRILPSLLGMG